MQQHIVDNPQAPADPCPHCERTPCLLYQGLYTLLVEQEEDIYDSNGDTHMTNKQIRFYLYRVATNWIHGVLGKGVRIELPVCVRGEILDMAPEADHVYTGFIDSAVLKE